MNTGSHDRENGDSPQFELGFQTTELGGRMGDSPRIRISRRARRLSVRVYPDARVEVVDLFHFLISMAQVLGMSADDVFAAYVKKNAVNFQRQDSGYVKKDHDDSKHI